jgi:hypothetical protein
MFTDSPGIHHVTAIVEEPYGRYELFRGWADT